MSEVGNTGRATRPRLLILSFSPIAGDARVLKQVRLFADLYDVTTCGFGPSPHPGVEHVEITPTPPPSRPRSARLSGLLTEGLKTVRLYRAAYWRTPWARAARAALRGREFDVVVSNDVDTLLVARTVAPGAKMHLDLHEYWPLEGRSRVHGRLWLQVGYYRWLCKVAGRSASTSTVGDGIAEQYEKRFGYRPVVVPNVPPYHDLAPQPAHRPIRLVHSGAVGRSRGLDKLILAATQTSTDVTLDLYLTHNLPDYLAELKEMAAQAGDRVTIHDPVPQPELVGVLAASDVGVYIIEPQTINSAWAMPNKIFDFIQARLGVVVGPSPGMREVVRSAGVGAVAEGFDTADLVRALDELTPETVERWKQAADGAAHAFSAEAVQHVWAEAVARIAAPAAEGAVS